MNFSFRSLFGLPDLAENGEDTLPKTRKALFLSVLRQSRFSIFLFSLGVAVLLLPAELWTFFHLLLLKRYLSAPDEALPAFWLSRFLIGLIPLAAVSGPFLAGPVRIIRNLARGEAHEVRAVFSDAVKSSWTQTLLLTVLTACLPLLLYCAAQFKLSSGIGAMASVLFWAVVLISLLWLLMLPLLFVMAVTYRLPVSHLLWNGVYLTFRNLGAALKRLLLSAVPLAVLIFACAAYPYAAALFTAVYFAVYLLFFYGLHALLSASYANRVCEHALNVHIPGARVDIGMESEYTVPETAEDL